MPSEEEEPTIIQMEKRTLRVLVVSTSCPTWETRESSSMDLDRTDSLGID